MKTNMKHKIYSMVLVAGVALAAVAVQAANAPFALKSVDVTLPDSDRELPDGPGLAAVQNNCVSCHSAGMILNQPALPKAAWEAEVAKMRNAYKAPINDKDVPDIVGYLAVVKGPK
jgi:mono/diheme cytochrome c family protein